MALAEGRIRFMGISSTFTNTMSWVNPLPFERQKLVKLAGRSFLWDLILFQHSFTGNSERDMVFNMPPPGFWNEIYFAGCLCNERMSSWPQLPAKSQALGTSCWVQTLPLLLTTFHSGSLKIIQELQTMPRGFQGISLPQVNDDPGISGIPQSHSHWEVLSLSHSWILKGRRSSSLRTFDRETTHQHLKKCYLNLRGFLQNILQNTLQRNIFFPHQVFN